MLTFFTDPYPDELLYSSCARYHYYIGNRDYKDTLEELFGRRSIVPNLYMGSYLNYLSMQLGSRYNSEDFIWKHTIFPYYTPFLPVDRKKELIEEMKLGKGEALYTKLGVVAGSICKKEGIFYCYECAVQDIQEYGEPYIHREHQLQGVMVCPHHGGFLQVYEVNQRYTSRLEFIRLDEKRLSNKVEHYPMIHLQELLYKIAILAYKLLHSDIKDIDKEKILKGYKTLLAKKGLTTVNDIVRQQDLHKEFINFYGKELLEALESNLDEADEYNWLRVATRNIKRTVHPIRHLLLINFLVHDIEDFLKELRQDYNPFGTGPWPCLNKVAKHYKREVISTVDITSDYKTRLPVGTFECECGFIYSRKGPDKTAEDRYKIGRIKEFGHEWDKRLKEILRKPCSLRETARKMFCDPKTILRKDIELKIYAFNSINYESEQSKRNIENNDKLQAYKRIVVDTVKANNNLTRTEIRALIKKEYAYLYRNDRQWLLEHLPDNIKSKGSSIRIDWEKRDREFLELIQQKYKEILDKEEPVRITKSLIGKELGISAVLEKKFESLPYTNSFLNQITESTQDFQLRRCKAIIENQKSEGKNIRMWQIQRQAGIRTEDFNEIKAEIQGYMN